MNIYLSACSGTPRVKIDVESKQVEEMMLISKRKKIVT
jgi:hypothetical protein